MSYIRGEQKLLSEINKSDNEWIRFLVTFLLKRDGDNGPTRPGMTDAVEIFIIPV